MTIPRVLDESEVCDWLAGRCPLWLAAEAVRNDPAKRYVLVFLTGVWVQHAPHCAATER